MEWRSTGRSTTLKPQTGLFRLSRECKTMPASEVTDLENLEIKQIFEKKYHYQQEPDWVLPPPDELFKEYYQLEQLQQLRQRLNDVKCKLNDYELMEWSKHTKRMDPAAEIPWRLKNKTMAEFVTVAWCKFFECLNNFPLIKDPSKLNTLHLCEAPGAFIAALNHYLYSKYDKSEVNWKWLATTLNPYYEGNALSRMIIDDRFMLHTLDNWLFHKDFTGNIIDRNNIEQIETKCAEKFGDGLVHLVTADGSIDCTEKPDCQEEYVESLHFAELTTALNVLADGGCFVMKLFTTFEAPTVSKIYLLNCVFDKVQVYKPATSKRGNSEVYIVCVGYKKHTKYLKETLDLMKTKVARDSNVYPIFSKAHLPRNFLLQNEICSRLFMNIQIQAIESNIYTYEVKQHSNKHCIMRSQVCNEYYRRYKVQPLPEELTILYQCQAKVERPRKMGFYRGSYSERQMRKMMTMEEQVFLLRRNLNEIEKSLLDTPSPDVLLEEKHSPNIEPPVLKIYKGKPYTTMHSSLFVELDILELHSELLPLFNLDPMWKGAPNCLFEENCKIPLMYDSSDDDILQIQRQFFTSILDKMLAQKPSEVTFSNFPFLTHYCVSILRYLSLRVFDQLRIATYPEFVITLSKDKNGYDETTVEALASLRDLIECDKNILCILDIVLLHRNEFNSALTMYNNLLLMKNLKLMLND